ncbi:VCBS repeat-containing protein [Actinoplanes sp. M2I2]|uniref:C40 family peptidase n=1 Tax=Actinoplanes sp. M2I2 TaxID=1734444 RepID=UPI0020217920|nr:VCBS repeat-containing protein [Actinoplanes sp. M2I2]
MKTLPRQLAAALTTGVVTLTAITLTGVPAQAAFDSERGGPITRAEVIERARYWVINQPGGYEDAPAPGPGGDTRRYRLDCSGYVNMVWHTSWDPQYNTAALPNHTTAIAKADLKPGDILNYPAAHTVIFESWANKAHTRINYYSFGSTPVKRRANVSLYSGLIDSHAAGNYDALRYPKIVDAPAEPVKPQLADVTGDGYTDLLTISAGGVLSLYANNIERDGTPYGTAKPAGQGWNTLAKVIPADVTGDGYRDLIGVTASGQMTLYANNIERDNGTPYGSSVPIGQGWNAYEQIIPADVTGDGYTDLIGKKSDGTLHLYGNNLARDGKAYDKSVPIGQGWNAYERIIPADVTGDGYTDLVAVTAGGVMTLFANNIERDGKPYDKSTSLGQGWNTTEKIIPADVTGDGYTDLIGQKSDGTLHLYGNNLARDGKAYDKSVPIGQGWNGYTEIL